VYCRRGNKRKRLRFKPDKGAKVRKSIEGEEKDVSGLRYYINR